MISVTRDLSFLFPLHCKKVGEVFTNNSRKTHGTGPLFYLTISLGLGETEDP